MRLHHKRAYLGLTSICLRPLNAQSGMANEIFLVLAGPVPSDLFRLRPHLLTAESIRCCWRTRCCTSSRSSWGRLSFSSRFMGKGTRACIMAEEVHEDRTRDTPQFNQHETFFSARRRATYPHLESEQKNNMKAIPRTCTLWEPGTYPLELDNPMWVYSSVVEQSTADR